MLVRVVVTDGINKDIKHLEDPLEIKQALMIAEEFSFKWYPDARQGEEIRMDISTDSTRYLIHVTIDFNVHERVRTCRTVGIVQCSQKDDKEECIDLSNEFW